MEKKRRKIELFLKKGGVMDCSKKIFIRLALWISFVLVLGASTQKAIAYQAYTHNNLTDKVWRIQ
jgi:hypothetical protein